MSAVDDLIAAGRTLVEAGLSPGTSGNVSVREGDRLLMSGTGTRLGALTPEDIAVLTLGGEPVNGIRPSKEVPLHVAMYARNPQHERCPARDLCLFYRQISEQPAPGSAGRAAAAISRSRRRCRRPMHSTSRSARRRGRFRPPRRW